MAFLPTYLPGDKCTHPILPARNLISCMIQFFALELVTYGRQNVHYYVCCERNVMIIIIMTMFYCVWLHCSTGKDKGKLKTTHKKSVVVLCVWCMYKKVFIARRKLATGLSSGLLRHFTAATTAGGHCRNY